MTVQIAALVPQSFVAVRRVELVFLSDDHLLLREHAPLSALVCPAEYQKTGRIPREFRRPQGHS
jgi:hypothetical protein